MLNNASSRSSSPYDARIRRRQLAKKGGRKRAKQKPFKERYFPFHRLPLEIIAEIFVLCLPDFEDVFSSVKSKTTAPLLLCNVSSSWCSLALSIPNLWNKIFIRIADPQVDIDISTGIADSWIARSGELPLSLRLYANPWIEEGQTEAMVKEHLNTFFRYASRWECVDIKLFDCSAVSFPMFGPTLLLRNLSYSLSCSSVPFPFTSCPLLSSLTWPFSCFSGSNCDPNIPWHQLTHITLHIVSSHQTLDILRNCQTLVQLKVDIDDELSLDKVRPGRNPVEHRSLRSFHIYVYQTCSRLLQSLTLPALTDLSLDTDYDSLSFASSFCPHNFSACSLGRNASWKNSDSGIAGSTTLAS